MVYGENIVYVFVWVSIKYDVSMLSGQSTHENNFLECIETKEFTLPWL